MNKLPQNVIVSSHEYKIKEVVSIDDEEVGRCKGLTHDDKKLIELEKGLNSDEKSVILLHEIIHAICNEYEIRIGSRNEEEIASRLSPALHNLFVDNPDMLDYFIQSVCETREKKMAKFKPYHG